MKFVNNILNISWRFGALNSIVTALQFHINPVTTVLINSLLLLFCETHPNAWTNKPQSFETGIHCIFTVLFILTGPVVILFKNPLPIFAFFVTLMVLQLVFVVFMMRETKGLSLEELKHKMFNYE